VVLGFQEKEILYFWFNFDNLFYLKRTEKNIIAGLKTKLCCIGLQTVP